MAGGHGHKFADLTLHAPKRWQVATGKGLCAVMWLWVFYRAKNDGAVLMGWRHPWDGHGHGHGHGGGNGHEAEHGHGHEKKALAKAMPKVTSPDATRPKISTPKASEAISMDQHHCRMSLEQHPKVVSLIEDVSKFVDEEY